MKLSRKLLIVVLVLLTIRILIPIVALSAINYALRHKIEDYTGHLDDLDLSFMRARVAFNKLHIEKKDNPKALQADVNLATIDLSWTKLFDKNAAAEIYIEGVNVVVTEIPKKKPPKPDELTFDQVRNKLAKLEWSTEISRLAIHDGSVKFVVPEAKVPLSFEKIDVNISNVHLSPDKKWQLANVRVESKLQGQGRMLLEGTVQPLAKPVLADMNFSMVDFELKTLNGLLLKFLPLDLTHGKFSTYIEAASEKGSTNGYAKLFFDDVDVVANPQPLKSGRHFLIEAGTAISNWILKNNKEKSVALNLPFKIKHDSVVVNSSEAFWSTLENKRDELDRKFENTVSLVQPTDDKSLQ